MNIQGLHSGYPTLSTATPTISNLPEEVLTHIFSYLPLGDLLESGKTCRRWRRLIHDEYLKRGLPLQTTEGKHPYIPFLEALEKVGKIADSQFSLNDLQHLRDFPCTLNQVWSKKALPVKVYDLLEDAPYPLWMLFLEQVLDKASRWFFSDTSTEKMVAARNDSSPYDSQTLFYIDKTQNPLSANSVRTPFTQLRVLRLEKMYTNGETFPSQLFASRYLFYISLFQNHLREFPAPILSCVQLRSLDLSWNKIEELPEEIGELPALEKLDLSFNKLKHLPKTIGKLKRLIVLNLQWNKLEELPKEVGDLTALESLFLLQNKLSFLPSALCALTSLKVLTVAHNRLTFLAEWVGSLTNLVKLDLEANRITILPEEIGKLTALAELSVRFNPLTTLPVSMLALQNLTALDCSHCNLTDIPPLIFDLAKLKKLKISVQDPHFSFPAELNKLENLRKLQFDNNNPTELTPQISPLLERLNHLHIGAEPLTVPSEIYFSLMKIEKVVGIQIPWDYRKEYHRRNVTAFFEKMVGPLMAAIP